METSGLSTARSAYDMPIEKVSGLPRRVATRGAHRNTAQPRFIWLFLGKVVLLAVIIVVVWALYAYLHAYGSIGGAMPSCCW